jgi:hypothetical protein
MQFDRYRNRRTAASRRQVRNISPALESLEDRALLQYGGYYPPPMMPPPTPTPPKATGIVTKAPHFYRFYTGPRLAELNAVKATAKLASNGNFTFTGTNAGAIKQAPAVYVWGIDRSGGLAAGPFTGVPNVKFDAVVIVSFNGPSSPPSAEVVDLASGTTTNLPAGSASIHGKTVTVTVPGSLLPSTGLSPSQYRFNYWPEDGIGHSSAAVASFLPGSTTARVGTSK